MAVRRNDPVGASGLFHDRAHFLVTELLVNWMIQFAHHPAGCTDFDQTSAHAKLTTYLMQTGGNAITQGKEGRSSFGGMKYVQRECMNVGMPARHTQNTPSGVDVR